MAEKVRNGEILQKDDDFIVMMTKVLSMARFIGISPYGPSSAFVWTVISFVVMLIIEMAAFWKIFKLLNGWSTMGGSFIGRLSGAIFYGNALLSLVLSVKFASSWRSLSRFWFTMNVTNGLNIPPDTKIRRRIIMVTVLISICALVEHIMSMMSATGFDIPHSEYFYRYIISSHGFILQPNEYTIWVAVPIFIISKVATFLWNFQDLLIILISMGLASRYHRLNLQAEYEIRYERKIRSDVDAYTQLHIWRKLREAYARQAALVRRVDSQLGALILLSNANNLYFICLQLFLGIGKERASVLNKAYYIYSVGWLLFRACSVVLAASDIKLHSKGALPILNSYSSSAYNVEVKRLVYQLNNDDVSLTGMKLFSLKRNLLLQVAATILKYELVLLQYDDS